MDRERLLDLICGVDCPVARAHSVLSGKWTTLILRDLIGGKRRYFELQRSITGISPRMLAMRLDELEAEGLISRTVYPVVPPHTEYALTAAGERVIPVIAAMAEFGQSLMDKSGRPA